MRALHHLFRWLAYFGADGPNPNFYLNLGNTAFANRDYDQAIADYTKAIDADAANAHSYHNRGCAWYAKQKHELALADFNAALELDPHFGYAYLSRALALTARQEFDLALADLDVALRLDPDQALTYLSRGNVWYSRLDFDKALDDYSEAIQLDPNSAQAWCNRASAWLAWEESARTASGAYQLDGPSVFAPAGSSARRGYERAIADYGEAIRLDPHGADAFVGRGAAWHCLDEYDKAIDNYSEAIRLSPETVLAFVNRGHAWRDKYQYARAVADFEQAQRIDPRNVYALFGMAWLLATARDAEFRNGKQAIALAHTALLLEPKLEAAARDTLAVAYAEAGDFAAAIAWEERALLDAPPAFADDMRERLELFRKQQPYRQQRRQAMVTQFRDQKGL